MTIVTDSDREVNRGEEKFEVRDTRDTGRFFIDNRLIDLAGRTVVAFTWRKRQIQEKLGPVGVAVYAALARHAGYQSQKCWPSQRLLADELGIVNTDTIQRALLKLEALNLIKGERHDRRVSIWTLLDKRGWKISSPTEQGSPKPASEEESESYPIERGSYPIERGRTTPLNGDELKESTILKNKTQHDAAEDAADAAIAMLSRDKDDEDQGQDQRQGQGIPVRGEGHEGQDQDPRALVESLLRSLGDDFPSSAVDQAVVAGWGLEELAEEVRRVAEYNGAKIRSKAAWLRVMLPKGRDSLRAALDRLGAPEGTRRREVKRLIKEYSQLWLEHVSEGTPEEEREQIVKRGWAVRKALENEGVDVEALRKEIIDEMFPEAVAEAEERSRRRYNELASNRRGELERSDSPNW